MDTEERKGCEKGPADASFIDSVALIWPWSMFIVLIEYFYTGIGLGLCNRGVPYTAMKIPYESTIQLSSIIVVKFQIFHICLLISSWSLTLTSYRSNSVKYLFPFSNSVLMVQEARLNGQA